MLVCKKNVIKGNNYVRVTLTELQNYLREALDIEIHLQPWKEKGKLPFFLLNAYDFFEISLLNKSCLVMIPKDESEMTPATVQKHWEQVIMKWNAPCIYVQSHISSHNRKRLINHRVPFIIPNNQIYLPDLGIDLREHFVNKQIPKKFFSPAAQAVIIFALSDANIERFNPSELAKKLGYTLMTMTRAFNELETVGVGKMIREGKNRWWIFQDTKKDLWDQTKGMLRSPIRNRESMKLLPAAQWPQTLAGISALAETTMINPPLIPVFAMGVEEYRDTNSPKGLHLSSADEADLVLEIWNYNPQLFSKHGRVDPFSLYLSLRETKDERIEVSLEELMEKIKW